VPLLRKAKALEKITITSTGTTHILHTYILGLNVKKKAEKENFEEPLTLAFSAL